MAQKIYVLDTNVLLHDSNSLVSFDDNIVVIPLKVLEELDNFKKSSDEKGRNARRCSRMLDEARKGGNLTNGGIQLDNGGVLRVALAQEEDLKSLPLDLRNANGDNIILGVALRLAKENSGTPVVVVTKDINFRIKANAAGIAAEDFTTDKISYDDLYTGHVVLPVLSQDIDLLYANGSVALKEIAYIEEPMSGYQFSPNECVTMTAIDNGKQSALAMVSPDRKNLCRDPTPPQNGFWGVLPRNQEQSFALALLNDPKISLVSLLGKAGTGKTLLAIAVGLMKVADEQQYRRALVSRPVFPMGRDLGFLPGELEEKLAPWMQPIYDNVDFLLGGTEKMSMDKGATKGTKSYQHLIDMGIIQIEALTYIRGRSIPQQYMIVDEAQNLTPHEVKTIITRAGEGTKIILTGDPDQIDNPFIDASSNGLTYVVERFRNEAIAAHMTLKSGERSELAEVASNVL